MKIKLLEKTIIQTANEEKELAKDIVIEVEDAFAKELIEDKKAVQIHDVSIVEPESEVKEVKEQKIEKKDISDSPIIEVKAEKKHFGQFLLDVKNGKDLSGYEFKASLGQNEGTDADGGYTTQSDFVFDIVSAAREKSVIWKKCNEVTCNGSGYHWPQLNETARSNTSVYGGARFYKTSEGNDYTASKLAFTEKDLSLNKMTGLAYVTEEMLEDSPVMGNFVRKAFIDGMAWNIDEEILNGTLSIVDNPVIGDAATVDVTSGDPPTFAQYSAMYTAMIPQSRGRAEWFMSNDAYTQLLSLATAITTSGAANHLYVKMASEVPSKVLFGRPINICEQLPATGVDGAVLFADFSQYVLPVKYLNPKERISNQIEFLSDQIAYKYTYRLNGAPGISSTITLPDSTIVSYFVQAETA